MSAELSYEIWAELKHHINVVDVSSAASSMIAILVDNDIDADEIRAAFKSARMQNCAGRVVFLAIPGHTNRRRTRVADRRRSPGVPGSVPGRIVASPVCVCARKPQEFARVLPLSVVPNTTPSLAPSSLPVRELRGSG